MRVSTILMLAAMLALPACQTQPAFSPQPAAAGAGTWRSSAGRSRPPSAGCFRMSYPSTAWSPIACSTVNALQSRIVGNGRDYVANVAPRVISFAEGSFPKVDGLQSVRAKNSGRGWSGDNAYSLQLNSQFFTTASCGSIAHCAGWVQFVYQNPPGASGGSLLIWDWLVSTTGARLSGCPPKAHWQFSGGDCVQTSHRSVDVPNQPIANLSQMSLAGMAAPDGDSIVFGAGDAKYAVRNAQSDDIADLSEHWQSAEFNVLAPGDGGTATFNPGTTLTVAIAVRDGTLATPACQGNAGTTAESNDLSFVTTPSGLPASAIPSIRFRESNVLTGRASCRALAGL